MPPPTTSSQEGCHGNCSFTDKGAGNPQKPGALRDSSLQRVGRPLHTCCPNEAPAESSSINPGSQQLWGKTLSSVCPSPPTRESQPGLESPHEDNGPFPTT